MLSLHNLLVWVEADEDTITVIIKKGDTLSEIAEGMVGDADRWHEIADLNPGINPSNIYDGQVVKIPVKWLHE